MFIKRNGRLCKTPILLIISGVLCLPSQAQTGNRSLFTAQDPLLSGLDFVNTLEEDTLINVLNYQYLYNGGGVAAGDINNDGWCDLYFTGNQVPDKLYLNNGDWTFTDISSSSGINEVPGWSTGVVMEDVNQDGLLDIYVCRSGKFGVDKRSNKLFINKGNNTFSEEAAQFGLADPAYSTHAAFLDYDRDGDPDLFLLNHSVKQYSNFNVQQLRAQRDSLAGNKLYRNDNGRFTDVSSEAGIIGNPINFGLGVVVTDFDNNGWPDIFVTNDYQEQDFFYMNLGNGTFAQVMEYATGHTSLFSMGADFGDVNNDGLTDFVVADMLPADPVRKKLLKGPQKYDAYQLSVDYGFHHQFMRNTLQLNNANGTFSEIAQLAGIDATDWSWAPLLADFDNDGDLDLYITNGYRRDFTNMDFLKYTYNDELTKAASEGKEVSMIELVRKMPSVKLSNQLFINEGNLQFREFTEEGGVNLPTFSNGAVYADLDNDGDLDIVTNNINDTCSVWKNNSRNAYLGFLFEGPPSNPFGLGCKVTVIGKASRQVKELYPSRGFQSGMDHRLIFGVGKEFAVDVQIEWPDGKKQVVRNVRTNQYLTVSYRDRTGQNDDITPSLPRPKMKNQPLAGDSVYFRHNPFIDYKREPLLTWSLSDAGPSMAIGHANSDALQDIYIGAPMGGSGTLLLQQRQGFSATRINALPDKAPHDESAVLFFDANGDGNRDLFIAYGGNELKMDGNYQPILLLGDGKGSFRKADDLLPVCSVSASCVKAADIDGDGDEDLFLGAYTLPGNYPLSTSSYIWRNDNGRFVDVTDSLCPPLRNAGMVTDAEWIDLNGDNQMDLVIAGMWMPVRVFLAGGYGFVEKIDSEGITAASGWWNSLHAFDADGDGDTDLMAGNAGLNLSYKASEKDPLMLFAADFDRNGFMDPVICQRIDGKYYPMVSRDDLLDQVNALKKRFVRYAQYSEASIEDVFPGVNLQEVLQLPVTTFETTLFLNRGDASFETSPLPREVQMAPVMCIYSEDVDQDLQTDLILAGNKFDVRPEVGRMDASQGVFLQAGGGRNISYTALTGYESGLYIPFEARAIDKIRIGAREDAREYIVVLGANHPLQFYRLNDQ